MDAIEKKIADYNKEKGFENFTPDFSDPKTSFYIISASGDKQAYYTLYLFSAPIYQAALITKTDRNPYIWKQNLSIDADKAIDKLIDKNAKFPCVFYPEEELQKIVRRDPNTFPFGKYIGEKIEDVVAKDMNYIIWLSREIEKTRYSKSKWELKFKLDDYIDEYFEKLTEKNKSNIVSEYIEQNKIKDFSFDVTKIKKEDCYIKLYGKKDTHYFMMYWKDFDNVPEVGDTVEIKSAKVGKRYENLGIKYNYINFVKVA